MEFSYRFEYQIFIIDMNIHKGIYRNNAILQGAHEKSQNFDEKMKIL